MKSLHGGALCTKVDAKDGDNRKATYDSYSCRYSINRQMPPFTCVTL